MQILVYIYQILNCLGISENKSTLHFSSTLFYRLTHTSSCCRTLKVSNTKSGPVPQFGLGFIEPFFLLCICQKSNSLLAANRQDGRWPSWRGWGLLSHFVSFFLHFPIFPELWKYWLSIEYHVHICQVPPQLSCGGTCQIWTEFKRSES